MTNEQRRQQRLQTIERLCKEKIIIKDKLIANLCYEWGCGRRTVLEYLKILEGCSRIKIMGKEIHGEIKGEREMEKAATETE